MGSVISTGEGRASVDFPQVVGRYVMLKWHPAAATEKRFSIAQVAAFGPAKRIGGSAEEAEGDRRIDGKKTIAARNDDGKEAIDGKRILDNKDIPAEGPAEAPAEGPPPALPLVPPFTFIPEVSSDQPLTTYQLRLRGPVRWRENVGWRVSRIWATVGRNRDGFISVVHRRRALETGTILPLDGGRG